jgi:hypothetical protein
MSKKNSLRPIHGPSAVLLYNITHKKFVSTPALRLRATGQGLEAYPRLTSNASEAGVILMGNISLTGHDLLQSKPILMRMNTGIVGTRIYLGVNSTDPLTGTGFSDGQQVLYEEAKNLRLVQWVAKPAAPSLDSSFDHRNFEHLFGEFGGATVGPYIYYGIPYILTNAHYLTNLQINVANQTDLVASLDFQDAPEMWVFLPTSPIYTCETSVNLCSATRGTENAFTPFLCDPNTGLCQNQYREIVTFEESDCDRLCGTAVISKQQASSSAIAASAAAEKSTAGKKATSPQVSADMTLFFIVFLVVVFVIGCVWYWRKNQVDSHLSTDAFPV